MCFKKKVYEIKTKQFGFIVRCNFGFELERYINT